MNDESGVAAIRRDVNSAKLPAFRHITLLRPELRSASVALRVLMHAP